VPGLHRIAHSSIGTGFKTYNRELMELIRKTRAENSHDLTHHIPIPRHADESGSRNAAPGDVVVARYASPCGSSVKAFDEMVKWAVRGDKSEKCFAY
jgi:hypothetical protein